MIPLEGRLTRENAPELRRQLAEVEGAGGEVVLDLERVTSIDSAGVAMLVVLARRLAAGGKRLQLERVPPAVGEVLALFPFPEPGAPEAPPRTSRLEAVGARVEGSLEVGLQYLVLAADSTYFLLQGLVRPKLLRLGQVVYEMSAMGSKAMGVVGLIAFLVGGTMALQAAAQLRQFGANLFVVDLVAISMTRELGPLMAAIVVAGRSGSAVAAEIGTMMVNEEVDALRTMGLHPTRFLVVPKLLAITVTQPLVTVLADICGITGGFLVAIFYLEVSPVAFVERLRESLYLKDLLTGLLKSVVFAQLIVTVGAVAGFRTRGGADAVGRSTTTAVVASIFAVIVADALASLVFYFGD